MRKCDKIYIAGHNGLVGSALYRKLNECGYTDILFRSHKNLDLTNQKATEEFFREKRPEYVFMCAGLVGGIGANSNAQYDFLYQNLMMACNVINSAQKNGVKKLLYLGSSCIYPKDSYIPIKESELMNGKLEPTNEGYASAKIAGIELCKMQRKQNGFNCISAMPCNLYGKRDNFDVNKGHFIPSMIRKIDLATKNNQNLCVWGSGKPLREFMYADDLADALVFLMRYYDEDEHINIGTGTSVSIWHAVMELIDLMGFKGTVNFDATKPDGVFEKTMDITKLEQMGWKPRTELREGLRQTIEWYRKNI